MRIIFFCLTMSMITGLSAQVSDTLNQLVGPKNGVNQLAIKYYGIDFTKPQKALLKDKELELIYLVDKAGSAVLSEINGILDPGIIDSLQRKTEELENFHPSIVNGIPQESIYFLKMTFPDYLMNRSGGGIISGMQFHRLKPSDFESIEKSGTRFDMVIGGMVNQFFGNAAEYLSTGGGMKMEFNFTTRSSFYYGIGTNIYFSKRKKDYPILTNREQLSQAPTLLLGGVIGKWMGPISIQGEISYAIQNTTEKLNDTDTGWIQLKGWSPGIAVNYPLRIGKEKPTYYYNAPVLVAHDLNVSLGLRYLSLSIKEANALMIELGISYRMGLLGIESYELKEF